jgi:RNA polymerase-binding transcription factor DksA
MSQHSKIKAELEKKLSELLARVEEIDEDLSEEADDDWDDEAIESADDEVQEGLGRISLGEIRQIELALSRIEAGKYGICTECGKAIGKERLKALPASTKCVKCS